MNYRRKSKLTLLVIVAMLGLLWFSTLVAQTNRGIENACREYEHVLSEMDRLKESDEYIDMSGLYVMNH